MVLKKRPSPCTSFCYFKSSPRVENAQVLALFHLYCCHGFAHGVGIKKHGGVQLREVFCQILRIMVHK